MLEHSLAIFQPPTQYAFLFENIEAIQSGEKKVSLFSTWIVRLLHRHFEIYFDGFLLVVVAMHSDFLE